MDEFLLLLQAKLDEAKSKKNINSNIDGLQNQLDKLKVQVELDPKAVQKIADDIGELINQKIVISNVGVNQSNLSKTGQQIGQIISDSAEKSIGNVTSKNIGRYFKVSQSDSSQFQAEMEKLVSGWTNGKGKITDISIQTRTSYDKDIGENVERLHQATVTYKNELDEVIKKTIAWRQIGTTINTKGEEEALRGFVEVVGQYSKAIDTASVKTDIFKKKHKETVANLQNTFNQISSRALDKNSSRPITSDSSLEQLNTQITRVEGAINDLRNATSDTFNDAKIKVQEEISALKILERQLRNTDNVSTKMKGTDFINGLSISKNDWEKLKADAKEFPQLIKTIQDLDSAFENIRDSATLNSFNEQLRVAKAELSKVKSELNSINRNEKLNIKISGLKSNIENLQRISPEIANFKTQINGTAVSVKSLYEDIDKVNTQSDFSVVSAKFTAFKNAAKSAGIVTSEFSSMIRNQLLQVGNAFKQTFSIAALGMAAISKTTRAISELKEIDTYLTEISKANDKLTMIELKDIGSNSFDVASKYGKEATNYLSGIQEASRAGYVNAEGIAELSVAAQGAGDMTAKLANQYIIATDKAYKLGGSVEKLTEILDGSNYITNHNAVNMTELAEGMSIVGSTAASFGVEVDEATAALGTMIATTQQGGSEMARAYRGILLNIRQVTDEEEGIDAEGLNKYEKACKALNVSLKETKNSITSLRDPMEVIKELSIEYSKLESNDVRRTNLLNSVGGKLRANALDALLKNYDMYSQMLEQYAQGTGSMAVEAEKTANSWEGSLNRLSNTWTDTVENIADSDAIINGINGLNDILCVINKITEALGSWGTIGAGIGIASSFKNVGRDKMYFLNY